MDVPVSSRAFYTSKTWSRCFVYNYNMLEERLRKVDVGKRKNRKLIETWVMEKIDGFY